MKEKVTREKLNIYYSKVREYMNLTHTDVETERILNMIKQNIEIYLDEHESCSMQDIEERFGSPGEYEGSLDYRKAESLVKKIRKTKLVKIVAIIIILAITIELGMSMKVHYDAHNAIITKEVIVIE